MTDPLPAAAAASASSDGYASLTPLQVIAALDAVGFRGDGRLLQLNSYENRVFQVFLEDGRVVVAKFYRPGRWTDAQILEEHAFALELAAREVPVIPPCELRAMPDADVSVELIGTPATLGCLALDGQRFRFAVSGRHAGRAPELEDPETLRWLGRFIGRVHEVGMQRPFAHRRQLTPATFGIAARDLLLQRGLIPPDQEHGWRAICDTALRIIEQRFDEAAPLRTLRLHGDCHPGNVLWRDEQPAPARPKAVASSPGEVPRGDGGLITFGPHVVDLDDACTGPAVQDLWMLLSGDAQAMSAQLMHVLDGYRQFMPFDERELALIEPLRTLRMIHHSAWIAERWSDPAFPAAFPWFGTAGYWGQQAVQLREQVEAMQEEPPLLPGGLGSRRYPR